MPQLAATMTKTPGVSPIEEVLADFAAGKMVVLVDDENRENEGDLVIAAEAIRAQDINFMAAEARGLICLTLTEERCGQLGLSLMTQNNNARYSTNFTTSIEAAKGVTTGISAADRATTVLAAVKADAKPSDIATPGHIFPVMARPGGVLTRAGHTEAGVDLARLCGFEPASVICEILRADGSMARLPDLLTFSQDHELRIGTIADLIKYRLKHEPTIKRIAETPLSTRYGDFCTLVYEDSVSGDTHIALVKGEIQHDIPVLVRVHTHYGLYDVIADARGDHTWTTDEALHTIAAAGAGVVVLLDYHHRREELLYYLGDVRDPQQTEGAEESDLRMIGVGGQILADIGVGKMRVLGSTRKAHALSGFDLEITEYVANTREL